MKISKAAAVSSIVTLILLFHNVMMHLGGPTELGLFIFSISPILMLWLVFSILKSGDYKGRELGPDEHWGYQDKNKDAAGIF